MDEDLEEKIRKLKGRMMLFEKSANGDAVTPEPLLMTVSTHQNRAQMTKAWAQSRSNLIVCMIAFPLRLCLW